ncbi:hypothetical protein Tamer19_70240 [Cupriavidus sp. TA19]|nr:hypothetical protein Tamer19_70240 [Cupriavidus sp. TA19]
MAVVLLDEDAGELAFRTSWKGVAAPFGTLKESIPGALSQTFAMERMRAVADPDLPELAETDLNVHKTVMDASTIVAGFALCAGMVKITYHTYQIPNEVERRLLEH